MIKYKLILAILLLVALFVIGIAPRTGNAQTGSDGEATPTTVVTPVCEVPDTGQGIVLIPVVEEGRRLGVETPLVKTLIDLIHSIESGGRCQNLDTLKVLKGQIA